MILATMAVFTSHSSFEGKGTKNLKQLYNIFYSSNENTIWIQSHDFVEPHSVKRFINLNNNVCIRSHLFCSQQNMMFLMILWLGPSNGSRAHTCFALVIVSRGQMPELLSTVRAAVRFFPGVDPHVGCQLVLLSKLSTTFVTLKNNIFEGYFFC